MGVDPVRQIVDRVAAEHPVPAILVGYEIEQWPHETLEKLIEQGLLVETTRATAADCTGCEWNCNKAVEVLTLPSGQPPFAFIFCDEEPDHGRIPVGLDRLRRFQASLATTACFAAECLSLEVNDRAVRAGSIKLGVHRGRYGPREVGLIVREHRIILVVGQKEHDLADLIRWKGEGLSVDRDQFKRLLNRKARPNEPPAPARAPDRPQASSRQLLTAERDQEIQRYGARLRRKGKSATAAAQEIAGMPFIQHPANGLTPIDWQTVRRILARRK